MHQYVIQFQGFHPSDFTKEYLDAHMEELRNEASHNAALQAIFTRKKEFLRGVVRIYSAAGRYVAVAEAPRLKDVCRKLTEQIRRQVSKRKTLRTRAPMPSFEGTAEEEVSANF